MLKFETIVSDMVKKIDSGHYPANSKLPTVSELCDIYGVSRITVRKAMDELEDLGMIARRRGAGTFVKNTQAEASGHLAWQGETGIRGVKAQYSTERSTVVTHVHHFSIVEPSKHVASELGMKDGFVYRIIRSRFLDGEPLDIEYTYMPISLIPNVTMKVLEDSIYEYIERDLGLTIDSAHSIIRATLPTEDECAWLGIEENYPLLEVEQTAFLADGSTFEYSTTRHTRKSGAIRTVRKH